MKHCVLFLAVLFVGNLCVAQNNNTNVNNNSTTVIINNQPTVEKTVVKEKTKVVYKTRPKPKPQRTARKLPAPVQLQGYLWVYPEDIGSYMSEPTTIIENINRQKRYGRDDWRVPTREEFSLMRNEANSIGLGPLDNYAYASTAYLFNFKPGIIRLVSTGPSVAEKNAANIQAEQQRKQQEVEEANNMKRQQENYEKQKKNEMESLIRSGTVFVQGNLMWKTHNMDAKSDTDPGIVTYKRDVPEGWRLPTAKEFRNLINSAKETSSGYRYDQYSIPFGTYLINDNGKIKTYNIKLDMVLNGDKGLLRAVKDM